MHGAFQLFFCLPSDYLPALRPWEVALPLDCFQILQLYPQDPLPGSCAALLRLVRRVLLSWPLTESPRPEWAAGWNRVDNPSHVL